MTHASAKMSFAGLNKLFVFIRRNIPGSVFTEPKVSSSKIPDDVMEEWESQNLSTTEWSTEFQAVDDTSKFLTSSEEIQAETDFLVDSSHLLLRTPGKRKMDSFAGEGYKEMMAPWKSPKYNRTPFILTAILSLSSMLALLEACRLRRYRRSSPTFLDREKHLGSQRN